LSLSCLIGHAWLTNVNYQFFQANVLSAIRWLLGAGQSTEAKPCESLFFAFAGHGLRQSPDGLDSARSGSKENVPQGKGSGNDRANTVVRGGVEFGEWEETLLPSDYDVVRTPN
jgi:hypothetical protein